VLVSELRSTVAGDEIATGSVDDRRLLSGAIQTSHFKGVRTVFDPLTVIAWRAGLGVRLFNLQKWGNRIDLLPVLLASIILVRSSGTLRFRPLNARKPSVDRSIALTP
jgi:hypothetical protein